MRPKRYAEGTDVPADRSRAEIETLLIKHGAEGFLSAWTVGARDAAFIQFRMRGRMLRYVVEKPDPTAKEFRRRGTQSVHQVDNSATRCQAYADAEYRRRWRALLLILRAKLEIVESGDSSFDREFLADIMLPAGGTVGEQLVPQIEHAYATGEMPKLLGPG